MELDPKYDNYDFPYIAPEAKPGHAGHLTEQQTAQVHQLRMMLEAEGFTKRLDTLTLLRFLRARKFDVNLAKKMFSDCETWRKEQDPDADKNFQNLDDLVDTWNWAEKEEIEKIYPQYYHNTDKDGRPVYIEELGGIDIEKMAKIDPKYETRLLVNLAVEYERVADPRLPAASRKAGHLIETCCTILDFKGTGLSKIRSVYGKVQPASKMSQDYYPERLGKLYLINTPTGFSTVWWIVSKWLDPVTVNKIHVLGSNYQKELLAQIPAEHLPERFGGKCTCENGCANSDIGPWREEEWLKPAKKAEDATA